MRFEDLLNKVRVGLCMQGMFRVDIIYRGEDYYCPCRNTLAYDAIKSWRNGNYDRENNYYTPKQAYQALWDECKQFNNL